MSVETLWSSLATVYCINNSLKRRIRKRHKKAQWIWSILNIHNARMEWLSVKVTAQETIHSTQHIFLIKDEPIVSRNRVVTLSASSTIDPTETGWKIYFPYRLCTIWKRNTFNFVELIRNTPSFLWKKNSSDNLPYFRAWPMTLWFRHNDDRRWEFTRMIMA